MLLGTLILIGALGASAQTVDEIVEKNIAAEGGRQALTKVVSRFATGTIRMPSPAGELAGTIEILNAAPNKIRSLVKLDLSALGAGSIVVDERFDGTSGYAMDSTQGNSPITGSRLESLRNSIFPSPFVDYKERGTKIELAGRERVGDRDVFALILTFASGPAMRLSIDAETYLPLKSIVTVDTPQFGTVEQAFEFSDFRDVDGVKVAFALKGITGPQPFSVAFSKIEHNVKIDPSLFVKPADK
jgi:hypothetical protein